MKKTFLALAITSVYFPSFSIIAAEDNTQTDDVMVVTANRFEQPVTSVLAPFNIVTRQDIDNIQAKTLTDVISLLPGVQITQNGGRGQLASIRVRGTNSDQVLVLVDGIRMAKAATGNVDFNQIPLTQVERIEFTRGARAALYGSEAIGGVINIITLADVDSPSKTKLNVGIGSNNYQEASASGAYKVGENGLLQLAAAYEDDEGYNVHPVIGVNDSDKHGFDSRNGMIAYHHSFNDILKGFLSTRWYKNHYQYDSSFFRSHGYATAESELFDYSAGLDLDLNNYKSAIKLDYQHQKNQAYDVLNPLNLYAQVHEKFSQKNIQWSNAYKLNEILNIVGGVDWRNEAWTELQSNTTNSRNNTGLYGVGLFNYNHVSLETSVRLDDNQQYGSNTTYNIAGGWYLNDNIQLRGSYGTAFKAPNLFHLYSNASIFEGNPNLRPESSKNSELSLHADYELVSLSATAYHMRIDDLITYQNGINDSKGTWKNVKGESKIKGIEFEADFDTGLVSHELNFDFKDPRSQNGKLLPSRDKFSFKWVGSASIGMLDTAVTYQYHGKSYSDSNNTQILPSYNTWDLAMTYWLQPKLALKGRVSNMFNEKYETAKGYPMPERTFYTSINYQF
ncbi:vitamin B12 receptor [Photobacterium sp. SKA34]|uniref:TonB-dependent vitamin B12 receptor n=1 Tax=Photobacterium sp. SKA34 TaxID=121723 RepID=UPI00006B68BF|nr:TonB-dependent vitamin B12 receptor [Photobacterium sp. SKA34]EAR55342.1 vitamin B12 receptor [Photobacterium sp. SKA34]